MTAIALTIAGSDSSGGAGIQADLKTFSALGVYGASAITALTAQNTQGVEAVLVVPPDFVARQIKVVARDLKVGAVKIGMLATSEVIEAVAGALEALPGVPVVLDPVMVAASGDVLLDEDAIATLRTRSLAARHRDHAESARGRTASRRAAAPATRTRWRAQATATQAALGAKAVLIKGGHADGAELGRPSCSTAKARCGWKRRASPTKNTHGTGCTLSSAIAAELAKGASLREAVAAAKAYVTAAIASRRRT